MPIDGYKLWLRDLAGGLGPNYDLFFEIAFQTQFEYFVPNDQNRAVDGINLRRRFEMDTSVHLPDIGECRILEMLLGVAIRMNDTVYDWEDPDRTSEFFIELVYNMGLDVSEEDLEDEEDLILRLELGFMVLNKRAYGKDGGGGGMFPLGRKSGYPEKGRYPIAKGYPDQREIEIWYQMQYYLAENLE